MNLREAVDKLEGLRLEERDWRVRVRGCGYEQLRADIRRAAAAREAYLQMAEAALAYMEHQATSVYDPSDCDLEYAQKRAKLWDAFMEAKAKAKAVDQQ